MRGLAVTGQPAPIAKPLPGAVCKQMDRTELSLTLMTLVRGLSVRLWAVRLT